jgi:subtilisin family serine protease
MLRAAAAFVALLAGVALGCLSPELDARLARSAPDELLPVHVVLGSQFDPGVLNSLVEGMPRQQRRFEVARILKEFSAREQADLLGLLACHRARNVIPLWIVNAVYCEATPELIRQVAARPEVAYVNHDLAFAPDLLEEPGKPVAPRDEIPWGVQRINAPAVWALGYTGQGIVVGLIDTGTDYTHPDLADHLWTDPNYPNHGWDFENGDNDPMDSHGHGTMTSGCIAGDGTQGTQCGVAPDAQLLACRVRVTVDSIAESNCWEAIQFCVSPPLSPEHGADVYAMPLGWIISWNPHQATWRTAVANANAAGLSQVVPTGGGGGSPPYNLRCPGNVPPPWWNPENAGVGTLAGAVTVGGTDSADHVASFSGYGPVTWGNVPPFNDYVYPPGLTKPDLVAPGVNIKTLRLGGGYTEVSGTSWSTGFAAGAVALLLSRDSSLSPAGLDSALEVTAVDGGPRGKDTAYGAGRIDVLAAVTGVEDGPLPNAGGLRPLVEPSVFRTACRVNAAPVEVLDATGRKVAVVSGGIWKPGAAVRRGVYLLRSAAGRHPRAARVSYVR